MDIISDDMCFACGSKNPIGLKLKFIEIDDKYVARFTPKKEYQGYKDVLHGGIVSTLLDEAMARYLFHKRIFAFTAEMTVKFKKPISINKVLTVEGWINQKRGRIIETTARIILEDGSIGAEATGKFLIPKNEK